MKIVTIQESFADGEPFWVALRNPEENQTLWEINSDENPINFQKQGSIYEFNYENNRYKLKVGKFIKYNKISSIAKLGNDLIMGSKDGDLIIYNLLTEEITSIPECHFLDIVEIKIFPSKEVIITRGLDNQIKLWSIKEWKNIRIMKTMCSSNIELIGKGRNFLVGNKQGEVEMWECGSSSVIYRFGKIKNKIDRVNAIKLVSDETIELVEEGDKEFELKGKAVYVGYESGEVRKFNLVTKQLKLINNFGHPITDLDYTNGNLIIGVSGKIIVFNQTVRFEKQLNDHDIRFKHYKNDLYVYNGEETLLKFNLDDDELTEPIYLVGLPEFFKVEDMIIDSKLIVASDYGIIMYDV